MPTYIKDILDLPDRVMRGDFVLKLSEGVDKADETIKNYVVTPQLAESFDRALNVIKAGVQEKTSKGCYLHGSFGSGKSHFMAILNLLLQGNTRARSIPELAGVISGHNDWTQDKKFFLMPYHMIGKESMEQAILGGYVDYVKLRHPETSVPGIYRSDELFKNATDLRETLGDEKFFAKMNEGASSGNSDWGDMAKGWTGDTFETALKAPPRSDEKTSLVGALVDTFFSSVRSSNEFVDLDEGLSIMSRHAATLGYDAVILFLDELILWLASRAADVQFVNREGPKLAKLVEAEKSDRPVPLISFVARQRDLKELIGDNVTGAEYLSFSDALDWWEARFSTIKLKDTNLPAIAEKRVLRPKSETARSLIDDAFEETARIREEVMNVLLTRQSDRAMFRKIYPFSPAFMDTLVAMSFLLQRERTALKVMLQILIEQKDTMELGEIIPVGDLFDAVSEGDEAVSEEIRRNFDHAKKLYGEKFKAILESEHQLTFDDLKKLAPNDPNALALRNDDRLIKTLLLAALAPNVAALKDVTAARLAALNHGTIKSPVPGHESQIVLTKCKKWAAKVGQIKIGDEPTNPTVSIQLSGVDTEGIIDQARSFDNRGNRIRKIRKLIFQEFGIEDKDGLFLEYVFYWRGTKRVCHIKFDNVRELPLDSLRGNSDNWLIIIDRPFDDPGFGPKDDTAKLNDFMDEFPEGARTMAIIPSFLSGQAQKELGKLVIIDEVLRGENFSAFTGHLTPADRQSAKSLLENQQRQLTQQMIRYLENAYGISTTHADALDSSHTIENSEHFHVLSPDFDMLPPVGANLEKALHHLLDQVMAKQFPGHPVFDDDINLGPATLKKVFAEIESATQVPEGRLAVETAKRKDLRRIAMPLKLGYMGDTHFLLEHVWKDHFSKKEAEHGDPITVGGLRKWMDEPRSMGLPKPLQNLIIMAFAAQTNRSFYRSNIPVTPDMASLDDDAELRCVDLPSEETWEKALERSGHFFGITNSALLNATNVAQFSAKAQEQVSELKDGCCELLDAILKLKETRTEPVDTSQRPKTATAAKELMDTIDTLDGRKLVEQLAVWENPDDVTDPAIGSSLKKAADVVAALKETKWNILETAEKLEGNQKGDALRLQEDIKSALESDEYAVALKPKLKLLENRAVLLIQAALDEKEKPIEPPVKPDPPIDIGPIRPVKPDTPPRSEILVEEDEKDMGQKELKTMLNRIQKAVDVDGDVRIFLKWKIYKTEN